MRAGLAAGLVLFAATAFAAGPHPVYPVDWPVKGERLTYRSCGCADDCWVAELLDARTKRVKARVRCDCERLLATHPMRTPERELAPSCQAINRSDTKMADVAEAMSRLVATPQNDGSR